MPVSGKLVLKGGQSLGVAKKSKKKQKAKPTEEAQEGEKPAVPGDKTEPSAQRQMGKAGDLYEKEFNFETDRGTVGQTRSTPWGQTFKAVDQATTVLHGYHAPVRGDTNEERLDLRCAKKADKHCK